MTPKTQFEKDIVRHAKTLSQISDEHRRQAYTKCFTAEAWYAGRDFKGFCTACGEDGIEIQDVEKNTCVCPRCGRKLNIVRTRKVTDRSRKHFCIFTTIHGLQVVRYIEVNRFIRRFEATPVQYSSIEICRLWIAPDATYRFEARKVGRLYYNEYWKYNTPIELKQGTDYNFYADAVYSPQRIIPELRRNGFRGNLHKEPPADAFIMLLKEPKYETLWKAKYWKELNSTTDMNQIRHNWDAIRVCIRNHYHPKDISLWYDMMSSMRELGKDTRNPHYVCPDNLNAMHDDMTAKVMAKRRKEEEERIMNDIQKEEPEYAKTHGRYLGISFGTQDIRVTVLQSVKEFYDEWKAMHHCVYTNEYYKKKESIILSARNTEGKRLATIEFSLKRYKVTQCKAACNKKPAQYDEIVRLVESHKSDFKKAKISKTA